MSANALQEPHVDTGVVLMGPMNTHSCLHCLSTLVVTAPEKYNHCLNIAALSASNTSAGCTVALSKGKYLHRAEHTKGKCGKSREMHLRSSS